MCTVIFGCKPGNSTNQELGVESNFQIVTLKMLFQALTCFELYEPSLGSPALSSVAFCFPGVTQPHSIPIAKLLSIRYAERFWQLGFVVFVSGFATPARAGACVNKFKESMEWKEAFMDLSVT